jgi:hypothetical protein
MNLITALRPENCGLEFYFDEYTQRYAIRAVSDQWREWLGEEWYLFVRACHPFVDKRIIRTRLRTELERFGVFTSDARLWKVIRELGQRNTVNLKGLSEIARNVRDIQVMRRRRRGL